jgi:putative toxin-antitoxin system antitoxin component (TIGR02293 family)
MSDAARVFKPTTLTKSTAFFRAMKKISQIVGLDLGNPLNEVKLTQIGVNTNVIYVLEEMGASKSELEWIIKPRTLARRQHKGEILTPEETGRWLRAIKVQVLAVEVFGDEEKAINWMKKSRKSFAGQSASKIIQSEAGGLIVIDTLNQIDAGFFA